MELLFSSNLQLFAGVLLIALGVLLVFWSFSSGDDESIVRDSYQVEGETGDFAFLIGESELLKSKSEQETEDTGPVYRAMELAERLPFVSREWLEDQLERVYLAVIDRDVSEGNIVTVSGGEIVSTHVEDELTVHAVEKAGGESEYDFYAGTYDSGYLIGGTLKDGAEIDYEVLAELDDRIRDIDVSDVDGDGGNEVLVTTHFDGITAIFSPGGWEKKVLDREEYGAGETFSHEVETGDVTGDGKLDIISTPSMPNTWDEEQSGVIKLFTREEGEWSTYQADELDESHIRKAKINPEDNSVIGGVGQRNEPYNNDASLIKYRFNGEKLVKEDQVMSPDATRNFYPFLVERESGNLIVSLSSDSLAQVVKAETMEKLYIERFSRSFEAFYTAKAFDYNGDGDEELALVHDGRLVIYSVTEEGMQEIASIDVYSDFDSSLVWSVEALER